MGAKSGGSQTQVSKSPHPIESNRMCLIPPASNYDNVCEMFSTKEVHRDSVPKVFTEAWLHRHILPSMYPNSKLPEEKQVVSLYICLYRQLRYSETRLSVMEWSEPSLNPNFQTPAKDQSCQQAFLRTAILGLQC